MDWFAAAVGLVAETTGRPLPFLLAVNVSMYRQAAEVIDAVKPHIDMRFYLDRTAKQRQSTLNGKTQLPANLPEATGKARDKAAAVIDSVKPYLDIWFFLDKAFHLARLKRHRHRDWLSLVGMQSPGLETKLPSLHSMRSTTSPAEVIDSGKPYVDISFFLDKTFHLAAKRP